MAANNRQRNLFTMVDKMNQTGKPLQQFRSRLARRKTDDVFEKDPFKIQSYNFRYAERPSFSAPNIQWGVTMHTKCEDFFYNHDFPRKFPSQTNQCFNGNGNTNNIYGCAYCSNYGKNISFNENRRRNFLQNQQQTNQNLTTAFNRYSTATNVECQQKSNSLYKVPYPSLTKLDHKSPPPPPSASASLSNNILNGNNSCHRLQQNEWHYNCDRWYSASKSNLIRRQKQLGTNTSGISLNIKRSDGHLGAVNNENISATNQTTQSIPNSACEININIQSGDKLKNGENVVIKIETDTVGNNLDTKRPRRSHSLNSARTNYITVSSDPLKPVSPLFSKPNKWNTVTRRSCNKRKLRAVCSDRGLCKHAMNNGRECNNIPVANNISVYGPDSKCTYTKVQQMERSDKDDAKGPTNKLQNLYKLRTCAPITRATVTATVGGSPSTATITSPSLLCSMSRDSLNRLSPKERLPSLMPWNDLNNCKRHRTSQHIVKNGTNSMNGCRKSNSKILNSPTNATQSPENSTKLLKQGTINSPSLITPSFTQAATSNNISSHVSNNGARYQLESVQAAVCSGCKASSNIIPVSVNINLFANRISSQNIQKA